MPTGIVSRACRSIDRPGVKVIVNPGGTNERFDRANLHRARIVPFADNTLIFDELAAEQADVMITDSVEMRLQQRLHLGLCAIHPDQPFDFGELGYLLPRYVVLKQFVDQWLHIATESGVWTRLIQTYPGPSESSGRLGRRHIRVGGVR